MMVPVVDVWAMPEHGRTALWGGIFRCQGNADHREEYLGILWGVGRAFSRITRALHSRYLSISICLFVTLRDVYFYYSIQDCRPR